MISRQHPDLWNTYDVVRAQLDTQYESAKFAADTGFPVEFLREKADEYITTHTGEPRIRTRAAIFAMLLKNGRIRVDPIDWFADHIETGGIMREIQNQWRDEGGRYVPQSTWTKKQAAFSCLDLSHTSPDWRNILKYGICGLRDRALDALKIAKDSEAAEFYRAVATVYEAIRMYVLRLAAEAERINAVRVIDALTMIAKQPPRTFHEALQLSFIYNQMQEIEGEYVRSQGSFDRLYIDYYRRDLASGRLTRDQAKELVKFFFDKFAAQRFDAGNNICFGGKYQDDSDSCNELTELGFTVFAERGRIDPKFSLRVHRNISERVLLQASECVRKGTTAIVFANDDIAYPMFLKWGKRKDEIIDFLPIGCYEPAIMGKELSCTMSALVNLPMFVELVFEEPGTPANMEEVKTCWKKLLSSALGETLAQVRLWEQQWKNINPSPVLSGTMDSCIENGRDVSNAGTTYGTSGVMCAGLGTLADSFAAIEYLVFEKKICAWPELKSALASDWHGFEELQMAAGKRAPKWGCNDEKADRHAVELAHFAAEIINKTPNARGGHFQMGCWSIDHSVIMGHVTKATPDGRKKGEPLSKNMGASLAMERKGVTGLINSVSKLDCTDFPDGSVLDVMLHPTAVCGADGEKVIANLIRTYFGKGGLFIHFNILDAVTLKKAQKEPAKYAHLQVRVCGWNARFVDLSPEMQNCFIADAEMKAG